MPVAENKVTSLYKEGQRETSWFSSWASCSQLTFSEEYAQLVEGEGLGSLGV